MSLANKTILITRTKKQASPLIKMLEGRGCTVLNIPTIKITDPDDAVTIQAVLDDISAFEWVIFTSANAVRYFFKFKAAHHDDIKAAKIACIGDKTSKTVQSFGMKPELIPKTFSNQGLLDDIKAYTIKGKHILLPVSNLAGDELQKGLQALGAHVKRLEIYKNMPYRDAQWETVYQKIKENLIDCITFYSPSALNAFTDMIGKEGIDLINLKKIPIAAIGASTAQAARQAKLKPEIIPTVSDDTHFVEALQTYFEIVS